MYDDWACIVIRVCVDLGNIVGIFILVAVIVIHGERLGFFFLSDDRRRAPTHVGPGRAGVHRS
jgi:hypothetical protein